MASVRRTAVLAAAAVLLGADGGTDRGVLLSLGSVLLLTGAAAATARRRTEPAGPSRPGRTDRVASVAPEDGDG
ncbi:hypothetical protein [Kitasatospora griseola]|uniref:hypothetical protein n=1 Tax=Kitasatospora griseola TaxID=2064 RepID=UPI003820C69D